MPRSKVFVPTQDGLAPVSFPRAYQQSGDRLLVSCDSEWIDQALQMAFLREGPYAVTYEERAAQDDGSDLRVTSKPMSADEVRTLLGEWGEYVESDPRHNTSVATVDGRLRVTIDEHNLFVVTGDFAPVVAHLKSRGYEEREVTLPTPHVHRDYEEFDAQAKEFVQALSALR
ncbi:MAG TPA: hypothetical protein VNI20_13970 [Fimbriimonadaceae bacterium]|nr:hypothetical protein [Fimbriimonadaceae bacterium]